jgi:hypothetical protein
MLVETGNGTSGIPWIIDEAADRLLPGTVPLMTPVPVAASAQTRDLRKICPLLTTTMPRCGLEQTVDHELAGHLILQFLSYLYRQRHLQAVESFCLKASSKGQMSHSTPVPHWNNV